MAPLHAFAAVLYVLSFAAEGTVLALVLRAVSRVKRNGLDDPAVYLRIDPSPGPGERTAADTMTHLVHEAGSQRLTVGLLALGLVAGTVGNFLTL